MASSFVSIDQEEVCTFALRGPEVNALFYIQQNQLVRVKILKSCQKSVLRLPCVREVVLQGTRSNSRPLFFWYGEYVLAPVSPLLSCLHVPGRRLNLSCHEPRTQVVG